MFLNKAVLISRMDINGITRYVNEAFVEITGYAREELIGKSFDIIRHPDMPQQAFSWLWDTLRDDRARCATIKGKCKSGDHYWVRTTVMPVSENGIVTGYASVGRQPARVQIAEAVALYFQLQATQIESKYEAYRLWALDAAERTVASAQNYLDDSIDQWGAVRSGVPWGLKSYAADLRLAGE